jgi:hypothetical protein
MIGHPAHWRQQNEIGDKQANGIAMGTSSPREPTASMIPSLLLGGLETFCASRLCLLVVPVKKHPACATATVALQIILSKVRKGGKSESLDAVVACPEDVPMPQPERLLATLQRAAGVFRGAAGRQGHVVVLGEKCEVCVAGDLHGNVENFRRLLQIADLPSKPQLHLVVQEVVHGKFRYPCGGDKSHQLLDLIAALACQHPGRIHLLPGNHELSQWTDRLIGKNDEDLNEVFRQGVREAYHESAEAIYAAYMRLIAAAPLVVRTPNRVYLSHSLPSVQKLESFDPTVLERDEFEDADLALGGSVHALVWGRSASEEHTQAFLRKIDADWLITGHVPQDKGYGVPNSRQIILDSQASPACFCRFSCDMALTQADLIAGIGVLN